jgi:hypothetical protein
VLRKIKDVVVVVVVVVVAAAAISYFWRYATLCCLDAHFS